MDLCKTISHKQGFNTETYHFNQSKLYRIGNGFVHEKYIILTGISLYL